jgi:hypothetical protein
MFICFFYIAYNGRIYEMLGLRETDLSAATKVSAGQKLNSYHLTPQYFIYDVSTWHFFTLFIIFIVWDIH